MSLNKYQCTGSHYLLLIRVKSQVSPYTSVRFPQIYLQPFLLSHFQSSPFFLPSQTGKKSSHVPTRVWALAHSGMSYYEVPCTKLTEVVAAAWGNGLVTQEVQVGYEQRFLPWQSGQTLEQAPRKAVEPASLEGFRKWVQVTLHGMVWWEWGIAQRLDFTLEVFATIL